MSLHEAMVEACAKSIKGVYPKAVSLADFDVSVSMHTNPPFESITIRLVMVSGKQFQSRRTVRAK